MVGDADIVRCSEVGARLEVVAFAMPIEAGQQGGAPAPRLGVKGIRRFW
jgi:hypothetical protein